MGPVWGGLPVVLPQNTVPENSARIWERSSSTGGDKSLDEIDLAVMLLECVCNGLEVFLSERITRGVLFTPWDVWTSHTRMDGCGVQVPSSQVVHHLLLFLPLFPEGSNLVAGGHRDWGWNWG